MNNNNCDPTPTEQFGLAIADAVNAAVASSVNPAFIIATLEITKLDVISQIARTSPEPHQPEKSGIIKLNG